MSRNGIARSTSVSRACFTELRVTAQRSDHIIKAAKVASHKVGPGGAVYAATKHAVRVILEGLRREVKPYKHPHHRYLAGRSRDGAHPDDHRSRSR